MALTRDILNRISNGIKFAYISLVGNDQEKYQATQISYLNKTNDMYLINPYGICSNPPQNSIVVLFNVQGQEEKKAGIANLVTQRFKNLKAGEVAIGNYLTESVIKFLETGNIEEFVKNDKVVVITNNNTINIGGSATINITNDATINCPQTTINGDVGINGNLNVVGDSTSVGNTHIDGSLTTTGDTVAGNISVITHVHDGVMPGGGNTGQPVG